MNDKDETGIPRRSGPLARTTATSNPVEPTAHGGRTTTTANGIAHVARESNTPGITPELLTTRQAAELAGVGERTWWAWSRSGLAPRPLQIGYGTRPAVRYRRADIMAWIAGGCRRVDGRDTP